MPKKKSTGRSYDLCLKSPKTRRSMYKKKAIGKQRASMCLTAGTHPRCVKGLAYCVKSPRKKRK